MLISRIDVLPFHDGDDPLDVVARHLYSLHERGETVLRWGGIRLEAGRLLLEVAITEIVGSVDEVQTSLGSQALRGSAVAIIVPTGVGAAIGGFIGDASPFVRAMEVVCDHVIVHPNVVNAADLYGGGSKTRYVDGLTLDRFFMGELYLGCPKYVRIGLIIDKLNATDEVRILNAANAACSTFGADIEGYVVCNEKLEARIEKSSFGHFTGTVANPDVLVKASEKLMGRVDAIAVITDIGGVTSQDWTSHYTDDGVNPIGALEALISRAITFRTGIPCAHAPSFDPHANIGFTEPIDPRAAAEAASATGLQSVLRGLMDVAVAANEGMHVRDLDAIIVPASCACGAPALAARKFGVNLVAVAENICTVGIPIDSLKPKFATTVASCAEAIGFVASVRSRVAWRSIRRPLSKTPHMS